MLSTSLTRQSSVTVPDFVHAVGRHAARYGLVVVIAWIGALKFTDYEAQGISGLVMNSPLLDWVYDIVSVRTFSSILGVVEIITAILIAVAPRFPLPALVGSAIACLLFLTTLSFLASTPGIIESGHGVGQLSMTGQFLIKDVALLGLSLWTASDSLRRLTATTQTSPIAEVSARSGAAM